MGTAARHSDYHSMPLISPPPPGLKVEPWDDPELIAAIEAEDISGFLLAFRGTRRARLSQDQLARLVGCAQSTVSDLENGKVPATPIARERCIDALFTSLGVPSELRRMWGRS
jgi:hypothetical protein